MRRPKRWWGVSSAVLCSFVWACPAFGQPRAGIVQDIEHTRRPQKGPTLTLREALDEAAANNPELVLLQKELHVVGERPGQARSLPPPMLEATIWQWPTNSLNPANTNMYMLMATQELPGSGKRALRAAVAEKEVAIARNDITARARQIANQVKQAYADLFISRQAIDVHLASVDVLRQFADVSQAKYQVGRISQQDVLKPVLELSRLHDDIIMLDQQAAIAAARLNTLMNRPVEAPIGLLGNPHEQSLAASVADLMRLALEHHPEIQGARLSIERVEAELAVARREYKPDFSVQAGYLVMPRQTDAVLARLGVTWPTAPWSRGRLDARVREASAAREAADARQKMVENALRLSVQEAYVRVKAAEQRAALLRTTILPQSHQTLEVSRIAYQSDRVDFLAMLDNQRTLLSVELEYYRALSDFEQAFADLERAVGTELPAAMLRASASEN